jgi:hypothetical protein
MDDQRDDRDGGRSLRLTALSLILWILISTFTMIACFIGFVGMLILSAFEWLKKLFRTT